MPIEMHCPSCSNLLRVPDHVAGKQVRCPHCQTVSTVPQTAELVDAIPVDVAPQPTHTPSAYGPFATAHTAPPPPRQNLGDDAAVRMLLPVGRSGWAIAAGYFGLLSPLGCGAPIAVILGVIAIIHIRKNPKLHGMGRAIFGLVMGLICSGVLVMVVIATLLEKMKHM